MSVPSVWKFLKQHQPLPGRQSYLSKICFTFSLITYCVRSQHLFVRKMFADAWGNNLTKVHPFWITEFPIIYIYFYCQTTSFFRMFSMMWQENNKLKQKTIWTTALWYLKKFTLKLDGKKSDLSLDWILMIRITLLLLNFSSNEATFCKYFLHLPFLLAHRVTHPPGWCWLK